MFKVSYQALFFLLCGVLATAFILSGANKVASSSPSQYVMSNLGVSSQRIIVDKHRGTDNTDPNGWTKFVVSQKTFETPEVASIVLTPSSGKPTLPFRPGQHVGVRIDFGEQAVRRKYSLSKVDNGVNYTLAVKREQDGLFSRYLHDELSVGQIIDVYYPGGAFILDSSATNTRPIVLLTAGIGISPIMSMVEEIVRNPIYAHRPVHFIHCARTRQLHAFRSTLQRLHVSRPKFQYYIAYSQDAPLAKPILSAREKETEVEATEIRYGRLTEQHLRDWLPADRDAEVYFLGPVPFMARVKRSLLKLGVPLPQLHWQFFSKKLGKDLDAIVTEDL
ncbi:MAG: hypothetical protein B7Z24_06280 [Pseudomonadales bacterium 32-42-5]|nr:MAG: hypothetical protein B7Z24_06280 [Pseudomonadales bacterium 32-42-5]